jgi:predicted nicotinamide N-methyase
MTAKTAWIESSLPTPADTPEAWIVRPYRCGDRELLLAQPRDPDRLLDDPTVLEASKANDYMPYWAYLWPGAILLADYVMSQQLSRDTRVLEIGCGLGLAGLAAQAKDLHVTFSDYSPAALSVATYNARLNGFGHFAVRLIDWQNPPRDRYDLVLGADVLYEERCLADVLHVLDAMLSPGGESWLSDPGRSVADDFPRRARERGFAASELPIQGGRIFRVRS